MPILEARHDLAHPVEGDTAWSESYYFNAYDPGPTRASSPASASGPTRGRWTSGMSVWLPGGELGEYRWVKEQHEMVDTRAARSAPSRYEMLEALQSWRLTMDGDVQARPCVRRRAPTTAPGARSALDVRFDAVTAGDRHRRAAERRPQVGRRRPPRPGTVGKGHLEQAGRWTGSLTVDGDAPRVAGGARQPRPLLGPAALGRPHDVALVLHQRRRRHALRRHPPRHRRRRPAPRLGVGRTGRATSVAEWRVRTELADDGVTHRVVHLDVVDKSGRIYPLRGDVLRVADIGRAGGTMVNEGLARWTYADPAGGRAHRLRHLRVPAPARRRREACRPGRVASIERPSWPRARTRSRPRSGVASAAPCRTCAGCRAARRASPARSTSRRRPAATLARAAHPADGPRRTRAAGSRPGRPRHAEGALLRRPRDAGVAGARRSSRWATAATTGSGASWLVVERLEGETIPRQDPARRPNGPPPAPR